LPRPTMTSRGRLTVPKDVRKRLGLKSGDRVIFQREGDSVRLRVERRKSLGELRGSLPANGQYPGKESERETTWEHAVVRVLDKSSKGR